MANEACESKLRSVARSSMHLSPGNRVAIGHAVVHYARSVHQFCAGIKCWHCMVIYLLFSFEVFPVCIIPGLLCYVEFKTESDNKPI